MYSQKGRIPRKLLHTAVIICVAVLCLTATQEALSKRILDFSFGVASAFDARVDCVGNMVFAICVGDALSVAELQDLKNQGVL